MFGSDGDFVLNLNSVGNPHVILGPKRTSAYTVNNRASAGTSRTLTVTSSSGLSRIVVNQRMTVAGVTSDYDTTNAVVSAVDAVARTITYTFTGAASLTESVAASGTISWAWPVDGNGTTLNVANGIGRLRIPNFPARSGISASTGWLDAPNTTLNVGSGAYGYGQNTLVQLDAANPLIGSSGFWAATNTTNYSCALQDRSAGEVGALDFAGRLTTLPSAGRAIVMFSNSTFFGGPTFRVDSAGACGWYDSGASGATAIGQTGGAASVAAGDVILISKSGRQFEANIYTFAGTGNTYKATYRCGFWGNTGLAGYGALGSICFGFHSDTTARWKAGEMAASTSNGALKWTEPGAKTTTYAGAVRSEVKVSVPALASLTLVVPPQLVTTGAAQAVTTRAAQAPSPSARFAPTSAPTVAANVAQAATVARSDTSAPRVNAAPSNEPRVGNA